VIPAPEALKNEIIQRYRSDLSPTEEDLRALYKRVSERARRVTSDLAIASERQHFEIPPDLHFEDGPFAHQGQAVKAWCAAGFRGVLEMATGSGKTSASLISAHRVFELNEPLLIVIAAPYVPLIDQWCREARVFGLKPVNLTGLGGVEARSKILQGVKRRLLHRISRCQAVVVSHDTLTSPEFLENIASFGCKRLLIADEVHNLGRASFITHPPEFFEFRLGLSATPIRQYDSAGNRGYF
jgi:superfamily II DNA or RNA helicase